MTRPLSLAVALVLASANSALAGFAIHNAESLDSSLGEGCIGALSTNISCDSYARTFMQPRYHGALENTTLTDSVCQAGCSSSLKSWFDSVSAKCAGKTINGAIPTTYGGYIWEGFNETCVKDPQTKQYCNDLISNFTVVDDISEMPKDELCHICYVRKLAIMQSSQYSVYNEFYKEQLEYVYAQCGGRGPTDIPPPLTEQEPEPEPYCVTGKHYTTEEGDTCESIANATSVSGAALYMGNQELLPNCLDVDAGLSVCVPLTCETFYVRPSDTCITIEKALEMDFGQLTLYNSWINVACTNLQAATDFYGKNICVSPQGGTFTGTVPPPAATSNPGLDDGYTRNPVASPEDVPVAEGTTLNCGRWHIVDAGDTCSEICMQNTIATSLFHAVNPSLESESCTLSLQPQTALCVGPTYSWNSTEPVTTTADDTTGATRTEAPTSVA